MSPLRRPYFASGLSAHAISIALVSLHWFIAGAAIRTCSSWQDFANTLPSIIASVHRGSHQAIRYRLKFAFRLIQHPTSLRSRPACLSRYARCPVGETVTMPLSTAPRPALKDTTMSALNCLRWKLIGCREIRSGAIPALSLPAGNFWKVRLFKFKEIPMLF